MYFAIFHIIVVASSLLAVSQAVAEETGAAAIAALPGAEIMKRLNERLEGREATRQFTLELGEKSGLIRTQKTVNYRKYYGADKKSILFYLEPTNVRGTGFLTFDYADPNVDDDRWLYLPALRKVRRISAADRGDYFLGTDFSYEDINQEQKVSLADYTFETKGTEKVGEDATVVVQGTPVNESIAKELGYSKVVWRIDPEIWMSRKGDYYDIAGNHLKTITLERVETIDGIVTAMQVFVRNHKTGHTTRLTFTDVDYDAPIEDALFDQARLRRGL